MITKVYKAIDLNEDKELIAMYEHLHKPGNVPTDVLRSIQDEGFICMEIYRVQNRLFMFAVIDENLKNPSPEKSDVVRNWDQKMLELQKPLEDQANWSDMQNIFSLADHIDLQEKNKGV
jgi:L-rhamnose mutarotase